MQKGLTQMNIQLANVISDLSGWTRQRIVRAILAGEPDPATLAALSHPGLHATRDTIAKSLEGTWQPDLRMQPDFHYRVLSQPGGSLRDLCNESSRRDTNYTGCL
jgi:hypothetical protein